MMAGRANRQVEQPQKADRAEQPAIGAEKKLAEFRLAAFGSTSTDFFNRTFRELLEAGCRRTKSQPFEDSDVNGALAAMHGIAPRDEIEGMLAAQMVAVHSAAMRCLRQLKGSETVPQQDSNGNLAVKLLRTYAVQVEALHRYRGKGEQKMTVEHVHVYQGGQAIVGAVHQGVGQEPKSRNKPMHPPLPMNQAPRCLARSRGYCTEHRPGGDVR